VTAAAVFLRQGSRPIPRVARMMRVARELGYNPVFFGAYRDANLPAQDSWEGFEIQRVGKFFPLVNGTRLGTYALGFCTIRPMRIDVFADFGPPWCTPAM